MFIRNLKLTISNVIELIDNFEKIRIKFFFKQNTDKMNKNL